MDTTANTCMVDCIRLREITNQNNEQNKMLSPIIRATILTSNTSKTNQCVLTRANALIRLNRVFSQELIHQ